MNRYLEQFLTITTSTTFSHWLRTEAYEGEALTRRPHSMPPLCSHPVATSVHVVYIMFLVAIFLTACGGGGGSSTPPQPPSNPTPTVSSISPSTAVASTAATAITVNGTGFIQGSTVEWNQSSRTTTFVSATQLQAAITATDLATAGTSQVTVVNPAPGGGTSGAASFTITNPAPVITSLSQTTVIAGTAGISVGITGSGFVQSSVVQWNQSNRVTTFLSSTQLQVALTSADFYSAGTGQITVVNATPGGGSSTAAAFTIDNPVPQLTGISPTSVTTVDGASKLMVNGSGFVSTSSITWNGSPRATTFVSATQLQAKLLAADLSAVGSAQIAVSNPAPGGGVATPVALSIVYPVPVINSLSPSTVAAGGQGLTLAVNGVGFGPASVVQVNATTRPTQFLNSNVLSINLTAADIASPATIPITVVTGTPGGGISAAVNFTVATFPVPTITSINPNSITVNSPDTVIGIQGTGFTQLSTIQVGSSTFDPSSFNPFFLFFTLPAANLTSVGQLSVTVRNPGASPSNALTVNVAPNPAPILNLITPNSAAVGSPGFTLSLFGQNFVPGSVVQWNGSPRPTTFSNSSQLTATMSASDIQSLGNNAVTVFSPTPGGGTSAILPFTTFLPLPANDLVYSPLTQLLYASIPSSGGPVLGNSIVSIDPFTGNLGTPILVGSEPSRLAISSDGGTLWVGLNGAQAVREVNLSAQTAGLQVGLGKDPFGFANTVQALAVMPGHPDTIAVVADPASVQNGNGVTIFDAGVARSKNASSCCTAPTELIFDSTGAKLYQLAGSLSLLAVDSTGITSTTSLNSNVTANSMRIDNGRIYLNTGTILDANTGSQLGVFSLSPGQNANGPVAPDSTIGKGFVLVNPNFTSFQINSYDLSTFVLNGSIPLSGVSSFYPNNPKSLVRWGQDGLAFITGTQVYILRSPQVKDLSSSLADLNVTATAPASGTTGTDLTFNLTVANAGPVTAAPATLIDDIPVGATFKSVTPSQGTCTGGAVIRCNLGNVNSGSSVTVAIVVTALTAGTLTNTAVVNAPQGDPNISDNTATSNTAVTGNDNDPTPVISSISPAFVQAGSSTFTLTVSGSGFVSSSTVQLNNTALPTTFVNASQLTATVDASNLTALGWAAITVNSPTPGGGNSFSLPLSIYEVISLDVNRMAYDPFTRKLYASIPSTATQVPGNSIVAVDPASGTIGNLLNGTVGSEPDVLAESQDGNFLYIGLDGAKSLTRVDLISQTQGPVYLIQQTLFGMTTQFAPHDIAVLPGNDNALAIAAPSGSNAGLGIFDISGTTITSRGIISDSTFAIDLAFADSSTLYSTDGSYFTQWTVDGTGVKILDNTGLNGLGAFGGEYRLANGLIYGFAGGIANPSTTPPSPVAQLAVSSALMQNGFVQGGPVAPDPATGRVFILAQNGGPLLLAYDTSSYNLVNLQQFTGVNGGVDLLRWGRDGLAWHSSVSGFGSTPGNGEVVLVRGPFVLPQWLAANPTPRLTAVSPSSITSGSGNFTLNVVGSNFVPGAVITWNGFERTTKFVDSSHLTASIPASDILQAGTATLVVNNPGSSDSSSVTFTIN